MRDRAREMAELRSDSRQVLADDSLSDDDKRNRFMGVHQKSLSLATTANQMSSLHRPSTPAAMRDEWDKIRRVVAGRVLDEALTPKPVKKTYKGKDFEKAKKDWEASQELEKQRILSVATSLKEARTLLLDYYERPGRKEGSVYIGTTGKLEPGYEKRWHRLAEIYGVRP